MWRFVFHGSLLLACVAGCSESAPATAEKPTPKPEAPAHNHPTQGPHGGALVELGDEQYHAEVVLDEAKHQLAVFVLDSTAEKYVPISASEVMINWKDGDKPQQLAVPAQPQSGEAEGKSSRFVVADEHVVHALLDAHMASRLRIEIAGETFSGAIKLTGGHDHDHDHKDEHDKEHKHD